MSKSSRKASDAFQQRQRLIAAAKRGDADVKSLDRNHSMLPSTSPQANRDTIREMLWRLE